MDKKGLRVNGDAPDRDARSGSVAGQRAAPPADADRHQGLVRHGPVRRLLGARQRQADAGLRDQDVARARRRPRSPRSRASASPAPSTRSSRRSSPTARPNAGSAPRASSSRPRPSWTRTPSPTREDVRDLVHAAPQRLPLHRVQADRRCRDGRGRGPARRHEGRGPRLQDAGQRRIWGGNYPRPTAVAKVTGTLDYGQDLGLKMPPETLHLALVQAKVSHANILGVDTSEAEKMPGVVKVITAKDVKGKNRITGLITFPTNKGDGWDRPILCDTKVFQYGDAIAIVAADTPEQAHAAAEKVKVDLEILPAYMSAPAAMADGRDRDPSRHPERLLRAEDRQGPGHQADHGVGALRRGRRLLPPAPAAPDDRRRHGLRLLRRAGPPDHPLEVDRPLPAPVHDRARDRRRARQAAPRPEPGRRHVRLQVQPDDGGPPRRRLRWPPSARSTSSTTTRSTCSTRASAARSCST